MPLQRKEKHSTTCCAMDTCGISHPTKMPSLDVLSIDCCVLAYQSNQVRLRMVRLARLR